MIQTVLVAFYVEVKAEVTPLISRSARHYFPLHPPANTGAAPVRSLVDSSLSDSAVTVSATLVV